VISIFLDTYLPFVVLKIHVKCANFIFKFYSCLHDVMNKKNINLKNLDFIFANTRIE